MNPTPLPEVSSFLETKLPNPINYSKHMHSQSGIFCTTTKVAGRKPGGSYRVFAPFLSTAHHTCLHRLFQSSHRSHTTEGFPSCFWSTNTLRDSCERTRSSVKSSEYTDTKQENKQCHLSNCAMMNILCINILMQQLLLSLLKSCKTTVVCCSLRGADSWLPSYTSAFPQKTTGRILGSCFVPPTGVAASVP